jgi:excisionase family DNA binding protein
MIGTETKVVYSAQEIMRLLGLSKNLIYKAVERNQLPGIIRVGKRILFSKQAIDAMLASGVNPMERGNDNKDV